MIAIIAATWILWTVPLGHPADAKPTGYYYPTEAQCQQDAQRLYAEVDGERSRLLADDPYYTKPETFRAVNATFVRYVCARSPYNWLYASASAR